MNGLRNLGQHFRYYKISFKDGNKHNANPSGVEETIKTAAGRSWLIYLVSINTHLLQKLTDQACIER